MKYWIATALFLGTVLGMNSPAQAETRFRISIGNDYSRTDYRRDNRRPYRGHNHYRPYYETYRPWRSQRVVYVNPAPVVVQQPVVVAPPQPVYTAPLSGDYGSDWSDLHSRVARTRTIVQRQHEKDILSASEYSRLIDTLDGITNGARERAYDRGGNLRSEDFAEFYRRLDQANEDIQIALAR